MFVWFAHLSVIYLSVSWFSYICLCLSVYQFWFLSVAVYLSRLSTVSLSKED